MFRSLSAPLVLCLLVAGPASAQGRSSESSPALRVVSLNPSLTAILVALDARAVLVGVDDFSARQQEAVADLPAVGGLFNPSLESVVALEPDLVVMVPSVEQRDFHARLAELGLPVALFENIRFDQVLENIGRLGRLVGREREAHERIELIRRTQRAAEQVLEARSAPRTLVVLQREPIFVVGSGSFIDELLSNAGARNAASEFADPYPRVASEWLVSAAPDVLIDMSEDPVAAADYWSRWPSLPAHVSGRVYQLDPAEVTLPGPYLDRSLQRLVATLHGAEAAVAIDARRMELAREASTASDGSGAAAARAVGARPDDERR